jgi:DNA repair protein RadC
MVSEKLARYGSFALSGPEHLALLVGNEGIASALIHHFGSIKALSRASLQQIRQFLPQRKAEAVVAAFSVSMIAESEHARSEVFDNPESVYRACADMKLFNQEVLRTVLLDTKQRLISLVDITKGTLNESLAHPREIFRAVISNSAYAFVLAHNHPSGDPAPKRVRYPADSQIGGRSPDTSNQRARSCHHRPRILKLQGGRSLVNVAAVPWYPLSSYREPAEPQSLFALALLMHQANAQDIFAVRLDQRNLMLAKLL